MKDLKEGIPGNFVSLVSFLTDLACPSSASAQQFVTKVIKKRLVEHI
jgi:hypothetical protein